MSRIALLIDQDGPFTRAAVLVDDRLTDLHIDRSDRPSLLGHVFLGRVERIANSLEGAFVDLGGVTGLLVAGDARKPDGSRPAKRPNRIGGLLRTGQSILVQVKADAIGDKGPSLTMDVALPGRFLVHTPFSPDVAVSKRLGTGPERAALADRARALLSAAGLPANDSPANGSLQGGWILRAGAAGASDEALSRDAMSLHTRWSAVAQAVSSGPPRLLCPGPDAFARAVIELGATPPDAVIVDGGPLDGGALHRRVAAWFQERAPELSPRLTRHTPPGRLFDQRDLDTAIADLLDRRVALPRGGSLVIEPTEALTVIDVNAGDRANPLDVNLDAAAEIARQLRLRNIGGIIVVDFVNLRARSDADRVLAALTRAVDSDPLQTQVYGMSKLGLVELTRARRGSALSALLSSPITGVPITGVA